MTKQLHDYAIQAAWRGANGRQYSIEFGAEQRHVWMLREIAHAIDPGVENGLDINGLHSSITMPSSYCFSSQAMAELFADCAKCLPARLLSFLCGTANP